MKTCTIDGCTRKTQGRGLCSTHYCEWWRTQKKHTIVCGCCGKTAQVDRPTRKHCSTACGAKVGGAATRLPRPVEVYTGPPWEDPRRTPAHAIATRLLTSGQCRICNTWFVSVYPHITCSDQCQQEYRTRRRQHGKDRRRARKRDAFVENVHRKQVWERDGYRCHLCRKKTDPTKPVPHPRAPTIDHVIPLASGGTHEPSNCRTACFLCNSTKGNRGGGEQLLLIA